MSVIKALTEEYKQLKARATQLEQALPNAREIGLAAHNRARMEFDRDFNNCVKRMREIENEIAECDAEEGEN